MRIKWNSLIAVLLLAVVTGGCGKEEYGQFILDESSEKITFQDTFGNETTVSKNPERTVILYNSILDLWYESGGKSLTKMKGTTNIPEEAVNLIDLGSSYSVSLEAIVALEPDLVVLASNVDHQVALIPNLNEIGIETMAIDTSYKSYERFVENAYLFSRINDSEKSYAENIEPVLRDVEVIISKSEQAGEAPKAVAIMATSKQLSVDSDVALTGEVIAALGGSNILTEAQIPIKGETRVPFSIESLVSYNPEVILISTMGDVDAAKETVKRMIDENPVWYEVEAVKKGQIHYLPKDLFVYKPNTRYAQAFEIVAEALYPDVFER